MTDIVYLDLETTGLDSRRHTLFEIGLVFPDTWRFGGFSRDTDREIWIQPTNDELAVAEPGALKVNHYNSISNKRESRPPTEVFSTGKSLLIKGSTAKERMASTLAEWLDGVLLAGCNVKFDQEFLEAWMRRYGSCPTWDYHVLDVPTYAAGVYNAKTRHAKKGASLPQIDPPYKTSKLSKAFNIPQPTESHTALGDARWGKLLYEAAVSETQ